MKNNPIITSDQVPEGVTLDTLLESNFFIFGNGINLGLPFYKRIYYALTKKIFIFYYDITDDYHADKIFVNNNVKLEFTGIEMVNKEKPEYSMICVAIKNDENEVNKFAQCMIELKNKILIKGQHRDYIDFCKESNRNVLEDLNVDLSGFNFKKEEENNNDKSSN